MVQLGNLQADGSGEAWVELPEYFEDLNRDFRYQLTAFGGPGPNLHVAEEISGNRFKIAGASPGLRVSWQVTGVRQDPWAEANGTVVEEERPLAERGTYKHPAAYGKPERLNIEWVRGASQPSEGGQDHQETSLAEAEPTVE
jgi:hypothetical protein